MIIDFSKFSTIKIGPKADIKVIDEYNYNNEFIIGRCSNVLINDTSDIAILDDRYDFINIKDGYIHIGAKTKNSKLFNFAKKHNIGGFEYLSKLPGSIGGSIKMNAGMKQFEISDYLVAVKTIDKWIEKKDLNFDYRYSNINFPIFEAIFEIKSGFDYELVEVFNQMRANQPKKPNLGSIFKNPKNNYAGKLLQDVGLKGYKKNNVMFSDIHANFIINLGGGKFEDVVFLINIAKQRIKEEFGILMQEEIIIKG